MKAYKIEKYGPPEVLEICELTMPIPKENEILIRGMATSVSIGDTRIRSFNIPRGFGGIFKLMFGYPIPKKKILGSEFCGIIEEIGEKVTKFKKGDRVFAFSDMDMASYCQFKTYSEDGLVALLPPNIDFEHGGAMSFGATAALHYLNLAKVEKGQSILINGASGSVGSAAIQLARHFGLKITAVCSRKNADIVTKLGALNVIAYDETDIFKINQKFDYIMDNVGNLSFEKAKILLEEKGKLLSLVADLPAMLSAIFHNMTASQKIIVGTSMPKPQDLEFLAELAKNGEYKPLIGKTFNFDQMIEAHHYVDTGHKIGNAVVLIS